MTSIAEVTPVDGGVGRGPARVEPARPCLRNRCRAGAGRRGDVGPRVGVDRQPRQHHGEHSIGAATAVETAGQIATLTPARSPR